MKIKRNFSRFFVKEVLLSKKLQSNTSKKFEGNKVTRVLTEVYLEFVTSNKGAPSLSNNLFTWITGSP